MPELVANNRSAMMSPFFRFSTRRILQYMPVLINFHQGWSDCVSFGDFSSYRDRFEKIQTYFAPRFPEAIRVGNEMIKTILEKTEKE